MLARFGELVPRAFMGYALTSGFQFAALFSFLSGSPFVFIEPLRRGAARLRADLRRMMAFMTIGSLLNARFAPVFGAGDLALR